MLKRIIKLLKLKNKIPPEVGSFSDGGGGEKKKFFKKILKIKTKCDEEKEIKIINQKLLTKKENIKMKNILQKINTVNKNIVMKNFKFVGMFLFLFLFSFSLNIGNAFAADTTPATVNLTYSANPAGIGTNTITATYSEAISSTPNISITQQGSASISNAAMTANYGGTTWTARAASAASSWRSVAYGGGMYVAISASGTTQIMSSPDGINWTNRVAPEANSWYQLAYGNGVFAAISQAGTHEVMTSPDGITWTARTAASVNAWRAITFGNNLFVAVAQDGAIMTSPDGTTWTSRTSPEANYWSGVTYGNGVFVAVAQSGTHQVITSPDGITWTVRNASVSSTWYAVAFGSNTFVAVSTTSGNVMTSTDGITWTTRSATAANTWYTITYGGNIFVAVSFDGTNRVMTSPDGITWTARNSSEANGWKAVGYGNGLIVAVSQDGTNRVMTSPYTTFTYNYTVNAANGTTYKDGTATVSLSSTTDIAGNTSSAPTNNTFTITTAVALNVALTYSSNPVKAGTQTITATYTSAPTTTPNISITQQGSTAITNAAMSGSGTVYTYAYTVNTANGTTYKDGTATVSLSSVVDSGGNTSNAPTNNTFTIDTTGPTVALTYSANPAGIGSETITATYSEAPSTAPTLSLVQQGSTAIANAAMSGSGTVYTYVYTVNATNGTTYKDGTATVSLSATTDAVGNASSAPTNNTFTITTAVALNVALTYSSNPVKAGTQTITATYTQQPTSTPNISIAQQGSATISNIAMTPPAAGGVTWTARGISSNTWYSVAYGNNTFVAVSVDGNASTSPDGITWTLRTVPEANGWRGVAYGNGVFVAVAQAGTHQVMTSPDGITWTARTASNLAYWDSVTYGNGLFVAVAGNNTTRIMTSPDGITWTGRTAPELNQWRGVTYGNGKYVAVSIDGTHQVMTSTDAITWTVQTAAEANSWWTVNYGNGLYVAVSSTGTHQVMTSPDGVTWTARTAAAVGGWWYALYGGNNWVAVSSDAKIMTSPDGITWTTRTSPNANWYAIAYGNNTFVTVGDTGTNRAATSPGGGLGYTYSYTVNSANGSTYIDGTATVSLSSVVDSGGNTANAPTNNTFTIDTTGPTITLTAPASSTRIKTVKVSYTLNESLATGSSIIFTGTGGGDLTTHTCLLQGSELTTNQTLLTLDGTSCSGGFSALTDGATYTVSFNTTDLVGNTSSVSNSGVVYDITAPTVTVTNSKSTIGAGVTDTITATYSEPVSGIPTINITQQGSAVVNTTMQSPGSVWTAVTTPVVTFQGVTYGNVGTYGTTGAGGLFVAVASSGTNQVYTSLDGINWTAQTSPSGSWRSVTYGNVGGNGRFVAVSEYTQKVMYSDNGVNWYLASTIPVNSNNWYNVTYGNGKFVAVSYSGTNRVMYSSDGITWTSPITAPPTGSWYSVAYGGGYFVAVSNTGTAMYASDPTGTWTSFSNMPSGTNVLQSVTYGNGKFVAVGRSGTYQAMTWDGNPADNWVGQTASAGTGWLGVTYGNGLFVAVAFYGPPVVMVSSDGITWTSKTAPSATSQWQSVAYGNGVFAAVGYYGSNTIMWSSGTGYSYSYTAQKATGGTYIDGTANITIAPVNDLAGNTSASGSSSFVIDTTGPTASIAYSSNNVKAGASETITATFSRAMADSPAPQIAISGANTVAATNMTKVDTTHYTYTYTVGAGDGTATVALSTGTDLAGNIITATPTANATFTVDNTAPTSTIVSPTTATYSTATTVALSGTSSDANLSTTTISVDGGAFVATGGTAAAWTYSATGLTNAAHTFQTKATDLAGNTGLSSVVTVTVDNTNPTSTIVSPTTGTYSTSTTVALSGTSSDTNLSTTTISVDGGAFVATGGTAAAWTYSATGLTNAAHTFQTKATDLAGNTGLSSVVTVTVDNTNPTSTIVSPTTGTYSTSTTVALSGTSSDTNLSTTTISVDGGAFVATGGTAAAWTYSATGLTNAAHTFQTKATDLAGNTGLSSVVTVTVDTVAPTVSSVTYSVTGHAVKSGDTQIITANFNEDMATSIAPKISISGINTLPATSMTRSSARVYTYSYVVGAVSGDGTDTVSFSVGTDLAGNVVNSAPTSGATFAVDNTAPTVLLTSSAPDPTNGTIAVTATFSESTSNFILSDITVTNGTAGTFSGSGTTYNFVVTPTSDGTVTIAVNAGVATDAAGNGNTAATNLTRAYDHSLPTSTITSICSTSGNGCTTLGALASPQESYKVLSIKGTVADTGGSGVSAENISIKDTTTNKYYSAGSFSSGTEVYIATTLGNGNSTWNYDTSSIVFTINDIYQIHAQAVDVATNNESPVQSFSFKFANSPPTVSNVTASEDGTGLVSVGYDVTDIESTQTTQSLFYIIPATLNGNITSGTTSVAVSDATYLPTSGTIMIDDEMISYTSKSGNSLLGVVRGAISTTAIAHNTGTAIYVKAVSAIGNGIGLSNKGTGKSIIWLARTDANGYQNINETIKVVANDGSVGNMIGSLASPSFTLDAASPIVTATTLLINNTDTNVNSTSANVTLKLQNVTGVPANENIFVQFSRDGGTTYYGANTDGTLSGVGTMGTGFSSNPATISTLSWPWVMQSRTETITVKIIDNYTNSNTDTNIVGYNAAPEFNVDYPTTGIGGLVVSQISDSADANYGKVKIQYSIRDTDTAGDKVANFVTPTFSYKTSSGWNAISDSDITYGDAPAGGQIVDQNSDGVRDNKVSSSSFYTYTAYWTAPSSIATSGAQFKVDINDSEPINNTASQTVSNLIIDTTKPVINTPVTFDAGLAGVNNSATITIPMPTDMSAVQYKISDDANTQTNPTDTGWVTITADTTIPWTFDSDIEAKTIKYQYRDLYGNMTDQISTSTMTPIAATSFFVQDSSNISIPSYDMYVGWKALDNGTGFSSFKLEYATSSSENGTYGSYASIGIGMNAYSTDYYLHRGLNPALYYRYRIAVVGVNGNISVRAGSYKTVKPDGVQNYNEGGGGSVATAAQVQSVVPIEGLDKNVTVTYKLMDKSIAKKVNPVYEARIFYDIGVTLASGDITNGLVLSDTSKLGSSGYVQINNEVIKYTGKTGNTLTGLTNGTWPTDVSSGRATRQNTVFFTGTPVWIMANGTTPKTIINTTISSGQDESISWNTFSEPSLVGNSYSNVGIRVLIHDNQDAGSGPLSSQNDFSENGIINTLDLSAPTISFDSTSASGLQSVTPATFNISLNRIYPLNSTVHYVVTGTAVGGGVDYTLADGIATITAGQTSTSISADIVDHHNSRTNKTIIVTLSNPTNAILGTDVIDTYTILNHGADTTAPVVTLNGLNPMHVLSGTTFTDPGATSLDDTDGDLTSSIVVTGLPVMNTPSATAYVVTYTSTDSSGNVGTATRDVYVDDANAVTFAITANTGSHGTITPEGATNVLVHTDQAYTITPDAGFKVASITIDSDPALLPTAGVNTYTFKNVTAPHTISATFADTAGPVITLNGANPMSVTKGDTFVDPGATALDAVDGVRTVTVTGSVVTSVLGSYTLTYSSVDVAGNTSTLTRTVNVILSTTYDITATSGAHGTVTPTGVTAVASGTNKTYTITPDSGFKIATLVVDNVSLATAGTYTFTNVTAPHTISATFADNAGPVITLNGANPMTITKGDTYTEPGATATDAVDGSRTVTITGNVNTDVVGNYVVTYTSSDSSLNISTVTRTVNVSLSSTYDIIATTGTHGTISPSGTTSVTAGGNQIYTITPDSGFKIATLVVDNVSLATAGTYTFTNVTAPHTISATFADNAGPVITLNGANPMTITKGDTYTEPGATATDAVDGSRTVTITGNVNTDVIGNYTMTYSSTDLSGNTSISTRIIHVVLAVTYDIVATSGDHGTVTPTGTTSVTTGANQIYNITPDAGYTVATLTVDGVSLAHNTTYTFTNVKAPHTIDATFTLNADTTPPVITVNGANPMSVTQGDTFIDPGVTSVDAVDGTRPVIATGTVNTSAVGSYTVTYRSSDLSGNMSVATRTVNVILASTYNITATAGAHGSISPSGVTAVASAGNQTYTITPDSGYGVDVLTVDGVALAKALTYTFTNVKATHIIGVTFTSSPDVTVPVITLLGDNPMNIIVGSTFTDPGATAQDDRDGDITSSIVATGTVNTSAAGVYAITYTVSDAAKNSSTATRTVNIKYADTYIITVTSGANGSISPTSGTVSSKQDHTYTITPNTNYKVSTLLIDGKAQLPDTTYTFKNVTSDHTISATFALATAVPPTITLLGINPMPVYINVPFVDPGATAVDSGGNNVTVTSSSNLNINTAGSYTITYTATDADSNTATSTRTVNVIDNLPPVITDISSPVRTANAAVITWTTDEPATSQVSYGTVTGELTRSTVVDSTLSIYHVVTLSPSTLDTQGVVNTLTENTPYFYVVKSADATNNLATSTENTLTTDTGKTTVVVVNNNTTNNPANDNTSKYIPDLVAPVISNVKIHDVTSFEAQISFDTDKDVLSFVEYGKDDSYGGNSADGKWGKTHNVYLKGLTLGTDYHIKVTAIDKSGNSSSSDDKTFKTKFFSQNTPDLTKIDNVQQYQNEIESTIESILPALIPPFIEEPKITDITENSATVTYRTNIKSFPVVGYIEDSSYDATSANPYLIETSDTTEKTLTHTLNLLNLKPNTLYHLQARAFSLPQVVGKSAEITFTTQASKIHGSIIQKKKDSFVIVWTTDEPTTSIVEYKNLKTGELSRNIDSVNKNTNHSMKVENLTPGTTYEVTISGVNAKGNVAMGDQPISVTTSVDITPPSIASFKVESSLVEGRTDRAQSIISWQTDEPSTSVVYYEEGSGSPDKALANKQSDTTALVTNHVIILSTLKAGTIYRFQISSTDEAGNRAMLPIRTIITPKQSQSIVDIIFKNFDQTFNFLKNVK